MAFLVNVFCNNFDKKTHIFKFLSHCSTIDRKT